ncbi:hypothetical protein ACYUJ6_08005 [Clostridium sp. JNZ X4-2]
MSVAKIGNKTFIKDGVITIDKDILKSAVKQDVLCKSLKLGVPRRWAFTPVMMEEGQNVEFYFSCLKVIGKRDIPAKSI